MSSEQQPTSEDGENRAAAELENRYVDPGSRCLHQDIQECFDTIIDAIENNAMFAASEGVTSVNPGVTVQDLGTFGLPLSAREARVLIDDSRNRPLENDNSSIAEDGSCRFWAISAARITFRNPAWEAQLELILMKAAQRLNIRNGTKIKAQLHQMLIEEPDLRLGRFVTNSPNTFGTLVICLPSFHEGGDIVVSCGKETKILTTSAKSEFETSWHTWTSSTHHMVKAITSGHRLLLIYNVIKTRPAVQKLDHVFQAWNSLRLKFQQSTPQFLIHILEGRYTAARLEYADLKGIDRSIFQYAKEQSVKEHCDIYFGTMFRMALDERKDSNIVTSTREIDQVQQRVVQKAGEDVMMMMSVIPFLGLAKSATFALSERNFLDSDMYNVALTENKIAPSHTGNEEGRAAASFDRALMVMVPRAEKTFFEINALLDSSNATRTIVDRLTCAVTKKPDDKRTLQLLRFACGISMRRFGLAKLSRDTDLLCTYVRAALILKDYVRFRRIMSLIPSGVTPDTVKSIGHALSCGAVDEIRDSVLGTMRRVLTMKALLWFLRNICAGYYNTTPGSVTQLPELFHPWMLDSINKTVRSNDLAFYVESNDTMIELAVLCGSRGVTEMLPLIAMQIRKGERVVSLISQMAIAVRSSKIEGQDVLIALRRMLPPTLAKLDFSGDEMKCLLDAQLFGQNIAELLRVCFEAGLMTQALVILGKIPLPLEKAYYEEYKLLILPLVRTTLAYLPNLPEDTKNTNVTSYQILIHGILEAYVQMLHELKPCRPLTHQSYEKGSACGCADCHNLTCFFKDHEQVSHRFRLGQNRRTHLEERINPLTCKYETERSGTPHTLIVTKLDKSWPRRYRAWERQIQELKDQICGFSEAELRMVLAKDGSEESKITWLLTWEAQSSSECQNIDLTKRKASTPDLTQLPTVKRMQTVVVDRTKDTPDIKLEI